MAAKIDANGVIDRLREVWQAPTDAEWSRLTDTPKTTISNWRTSNRVPLDFCVEAVHKFGTTFDWLLLGRGPRTYTPTADIAEGAASYGDARADRIARFIGYWQASHDTDDMAWLERTLARAVPEYDAWLADQAKG